MQKVKKILIVGEGIGGVNTALELDRILPEEVEIEFISNTSHLEYEPQFYKFFNDQEVANPYISYKDIFEDTRVEIKKDVIDHINFDEKIVYGWHATPYHFDYVVFALKNEISYYDVYGMKDLTFNSLSLSDVLQLKSHLHEVMSINKIYPEESKNIHIVIIGGNRSGCEIAGSIAQYTKKLTKKYNTLTLTISIDLIESESRLISELSKSNSQKIQEYLQNLGINIHLHRDVSKEEIEEVYLKDMEQNKKIVIWCKEIIPNHFFDKIEGFRLDDKGRVLVDSHLQVRGKKHIFVIGESVSKSYSSAFFTPLIDSKYVSEYIAHEIAHKKYHSYRPLKQKSIISIGSGYAICQIGLITFSGWIGWLIKRSFDLHFLLSILPFSKALKIFKSNRV
ncbi:MAG: FAD-dependent oxidoreductase [Candidatus Roizmanbacteria bacterium]